MKKEKIILDVDTGSDDAIAIICAALHPELDLLALTTVCGNKPVLNTTENTLRVVDLLGLNIPVYRGCAEPMVAELIPERHAETRQTAAKAVKDGEVIEYHSDYLELPPASSKVQQKNAVSFLIDTLLESDGDITLVAVGPLTNLAVAMRADERIIEKIKRIVIMGGGHEVGNRTPSAEFNIWKDPEAAQIVFTSGCEILLVPLDATHVGVVTYDESKTIREIGTPVAVAVSDFLDQRIKAYDELQPMEIAGSTPPHDALAVLAAVDETILKDVQLKRVDVDFGGGLADGRTIVDNRVPTDNPPNIHFAFNCHREKFVAMLTETIALSKNL